MPHVAPSIPGAVAFLVGQAEVNNPVAASLCDGDYVIDFGSVWPPTQPAFGLVQVVELLTMAGVITAPTRHRCPCSAVWAVRPEPKLAPPSDELVG